MLCITLIDFIALDLFIDRYFSISVPFMVSLPHLSSFLYYCTEKEFLCILSADMFSLELLQICFWNFGMLLKF